MTRAALRLLRHLPALASLLVVVAAPTLHGSLSHAAEACADAHAVEACAGVDPAGPAGTIAPAAEDCSLCLVVGQARTALPSVPVLGAASSAPPARRPAPPDVSQRHGLEPLALAAPRAPPATA